MSKNRYKFRKEFALNIELSGAVSAGARQEINVSYNLIYRTLKGSKHD